MTVILSFIDKNEILNSTDFKSFNVNRLRWMKLGLRIKFVNAIK